MRSRLLYFTLSLLLLGLLAGCVRNAEPASTPAPETEDRESAAEVSEPTDTPASPTDAPTPPATDTPSPLPTPTPVSPLPTAEPLPTLAADPCEEELTGVDVVVARQFPELGCPETTPTFTSMARQPFQRGQMIWREDTGTIYVLLENGRWSSYNDEFQEGDPESDPSLTPPEGLFQPIRGFGLVWREELGGPESDILWAILPEQGVTGSIQEWEHGLLIGFELPDQFVLLENGVWEQVE